LPSAGHLDFRHTPDTRRIGKDHDAPNVGVYKVGHSDPLEPDAGNWWDFLVKQNFTVATWSQDGPRFAEAYASAKMAFARLVFETKNLKPVPPIALVGHSRGGLLIRKLLKESPPLAGVERVRWVVTLHSPHHGSDMARAYAEVGAEVVDLMDAKIPASMPGPFGNIPITGPIKAELKKVAVELLRPLNKWWMADNDRELMTDGPLVRDLAQGEAALPGVKYYTFGGDTPTYFKLYVWVFDPNSAVPQYKVQTQGIHTKGKQYFVWRVKAVELPTISPLLDKVRNFTPEITPGKGDGFVSDKSARLPFSIHETNHRNHMEVLWDKGLQLKVLGILTAK
jgi:pimeloyl-ACP methyl ester carboxylesterase